MKNNTTGIGIIGASEGGWAVRAHIPALKKLQDHFTLSAVSTTNLASAAATARAFDVPHAFENAYDLVNSPDVGLVVVTVKVPRHRQLVEAALNAGKMVFCEWPLGNGTSEAVYLNELAREKNIRTFCGLQSGSLPEMKFVRDLLAGGHLGEIFSATVIGGGNNWGTTLPDRSLAYMLDPANGATMLHVPFAHTLNGLQYCMGNFDTFSSLLVRRNHEVTVAGSHEKIAQLSHDQIVLMGQLENGVVASLHYHGGESGGINLYWEIKGSKGELVISSPTGHLQFGKLRIEASIGDGPLRAMEIPAQYRPMEGGAPGYDAEPARGLYYAYQEIASDILHGTTTFPDFSAAVKHHQLLDRIEAAS